MFQRRPHQIQANDLMLKHSKGIICAVTGAGKTRIGIFDTMKQFETDESQTVVVVAPRLMLANQLSSEYLEFITNASVFHCHSGDTVHESSTTPKVIANWVKNTPGHKLIFTTYHSLQKLIDADIHIDVAHLDEAHHSVKKNFFPAVEKLSQNVKRFYSYTATPKYSSRFNKPGMNWGHVYGQIIVNISAPDMISGGYIVPPNIQAKQINAVRDKEFGAERDCMTLLDTILNEENMEKVLVAAPNTKVLMRMLAETEFMTEVQSYGYDVLWITAKYGAFINQTKVTREEFFNTLKEYGKDPNKKFILLHYSILSEGIDCPGLTSCVLMRNMDYTSVCQTIGRVIRIHESDVEGMKSGNIIPGDLSSYKKPYGLVHIPVYNNTGINTAKKVQNVANIVFIQGNPMISTINK